MCRINLLSAPADWLTCWSLNTFQWARALCVQQEPFAALCINQVLCVPPCMYVLTHVVRVSLRSANPCEHNTHCVTHFVLTHVLVPVSLCSANARTGKHAWLGHGWSGCSRVYERPALLDADFGEPTDAVCMETAPGSGIFTREWTKASVKTDCNTWTSTITMK